MGNEMKSIIDNATNRHCTRQHITANSYTKCLEQYVVPIYFIGWLLFSFAFAFMFYSPNEEIPKKRRILEKKMSTHLLSICVYFFVVHSKAWDSFKVRFSLCWCASINEGEAMLNAWFHQAIDFFSSSLLIFGFSF